MSREYDIKNAAWDYFEYLDSHHFHLLPHCNPQTDAFKAGAKWADKTMIKRVLNFIFEYIYEHQHISGHICTDSFSFQSLEELEEELIKSMEE